ncbi:MAG: ATP-dependent Clp protease proteolytic subunit [Pseudomonadota bacterium]
MSVTAPSDQPMGATALPQHDASSVARRPLSAFLGTIQDGRFLKIVFLAMLACTVAVLGLDLREMVERDVSTVPGLQRMEPAPMDLPRPGDQTRPYLPRTMPLGPSRDTPVLPGYFGPLDSQVMAAPMDFHRGPNGNYSAIGTIAPGTAKRFAAYLAENPKQIDTLYLHSPGGSVSDGLAMAKAVRAAGINTRVPAHGYCASSCPIVMSGGLYRSAGERAWVGVHQIYAPPPASGTLQRGMSDAQTVSAEVQNLLVQHGVDPQVWIFAMQTPSASLYVLRPDQLRRWRMANYPRPKTVPAPRPQL